MNVKLPKSHYSYSKIQKSFSERYIIINLNLCMCLHVCHRKSFDLELSCIIYHIAGKFGGIKFG